MNKPKLILIGFLDTLGASLYILLVATFMNYAGKHFPKEDGILAPVTFLTVFMLSALVTSSLILGYPIWLYFEKRKREALFAFVSVVSWLFIFLIALSVIQTVR